MGSFERRGGSLPQKERRWGEAGRGPEVAVAARPGRSEADGTASMGLGRVMAATSEPAVGPHASGLLALMTPTQGWIHEKSEKIADLRRTNTGLDEKIREIRDRVRG
jgi:hypothetical protein